jgi:hypothetical protein
VASHPTRSPDDEHERFVQFFKNAQNRSSMQTRRSANFKLAQQAPTIWCAVNAGRCTRIICISPRNLRPAWACRRNNLVLHRIPCSGADRRWRGSRCLRQLLTSQAACSSRFHDGSVTGIGEQIGRYDDSSCYRTPACHSVQPGHGDPQSSLAPGSRSSGTKLSGIPNAVSSLARLQMRHRAPVAPQSQARSPSHGTPG